MRPGLRLVVLILLAASAWAKPAAPTQPPPPSPTPAWLTAHGDQVYSAKVTVRLGLSDQNPTWELRHTHVAMLVDKLQALHPTPLAEEVEIKPTPTLKLLEQAPSPQQDADSYLGLSITLGLADGTQLPTLLISRGRILLHGHAWGPDHGRLLEYWLFSTARIRRDLLLASQVLPVPTFEQCRLLGNQIVETTPRQCILPNNDILLDLHEPLTKASLKVKSYKECLAHGAALIYTYPRRCMVAGGHVFTEPPTVEDPVAAAEAQAAKEAPTPIDKPLPAGPTLKDLLDSKAKPEAEPAPVSATAPISQTAPAPSSTAVVSQPGLGFYTVPSATTPVSPSPTAAATPSPSVVKETKPASPTAPISPTAAVSTAIPQESLADLLKTLPSPTAK